MSQPCYLCVSNIGDTDPLNYGGQFVIVDLRGCYHPRLLVLEPTGENSWGDPTGWLLHEIECERLTAIKDSLGHYVALSDNPYHVDYPVWWGDEKSLAEFSSYTGQPVTDLVENAVSRNPLKVCQVYADAFSYFERQSFCENPRQLSRRQAEKLCHAMETDIKRYGSLHDGYSFSFS